jgi:hypothetical protein
VSFCESRNNIHELEDPKVPMNDLWYTKAELDDMAAVVRLANIAVNDACGDLDVSNAVQIHREGVLSSQPTQIVETSKSLSESSSRLARLHALLLEKDIAARSGVPVTYDMLWTIIQKIMPYTVDDDDDDETGSDTDTGSVGTIDQEEHHSRDVHDELIDASDLEYIFDDDLEDENEKGTPDPPPRSESWSCTRGDLSSCRSIPSITSTHDVPITKMTQSTSTDSVSYPRRITTKPGVSDATAFSPSDNNNFTWNKSSVSYTEENHLTKETLGILQRELGNASDVRARRRNDRPFIEHECAEPNSQEQRQPSAAGTSNISGILKRSRSVICGDSMNDDDYVPDKKRARQTLALEEQDGQDGLWLPDEYRCYVADAMISLARWEFRGHNLPMH